MRKIWILVPALLVIAAGALLQALKSESFVLKLAYGGVNYLTDLRLEMRNPHIDFYGGSLSADELHLIPKATTGPALISVLNLKAQVNYHDLFNSNLVNSSLSATELLVYVSKQDEATDPSPISWLAYLRWLPRALRIEQMHVIRPRPIPWFCHLSTYTVIAWAEGITAPQLILITRVSRWVQCWMCTR
jgi:hypothetical protein